VNGVGTHDDARAAGEAVDRLVEVVVLLRQYCPWTAALDHASLLRYLVEETYELYEAVDDVSRSEHPATGRLDDLRDELGDLLFQVVLHAQLQAERGTFALADVARSLTDKLVRRNPHVLAPDGTVHPAVLGGAQATTEEIVMAWRAVKEREKPARTSPFDGIPHHLPALSFAAKTLDRAGATQSEVVADSCGDESEADTEARIGAELLAVTRSAVTAGIDPERALRRAVLDHQRDVLDAM
jgi:uncharacterized protein YabN with tetrapyrrole methylase and pyrophosphatase domain